ncbi:serrate RNA effector molecule-like protein isoform X1 [Gossypium australe]|uniref:Serrate RNA effector molecule-like protein isoform X1 n=1 Tax=Gossypium australe TaxID=47621 RepID=A0A5B6WQH4_9ROSI|nr:serrate RNA effector molecule-like protein isoform X1 [Gossypium australe]
MQVVRGRIFCSKYSAAPATWVGVRRGRSFAASLPSPSDSPKRKRVSKDERRDLIESFVNRYKSVNAGKFPSVTAVQKEVGGSYYVVRKVLQELEYKSKICSSNSSYENLSAKAANKRDKSFSVVEVVSTVVQDDTCARAMDDVKMHGTNDKQLEADRGSCHDFVLEENSVLTVDAKGLEKQEDDKVGGLEIDDSDNFLIFPDKQKIVEATEQDLESDKLFKTESQSVQSEFGVVKDDLPKEETQIGNEEGDKKEQAISKESLDSGSPEPKAEHHPKILEEEKHKHHPEFLEEEKYARNPSSEQTENAEGSKKSTLWGNLKSFAGGIINIWRKL